MIWFLISLICGAKPKTKYSTCPQQMKQYFSIKKFEVFHPADTRGVNIQLQIVAELNHKVEEPYVEIQVTSGRIPFLRLLDPLCRPGILICPASFSQLVYGAQIPIPSTMPHGDYTLRIIFREGNERLSCYEAPLVVKNVDIEQLTIDEQERQQKEEEARRDGWDDD